MVGSGGLGSEGGKRQQRRRPVKEIASSECAHQINDMPMRYTSPSHHLFEGVLRTQLLPQQSWRYSPNHQIPKIPLIAAWDRLPRLSLSLLARLDERLSRQSAVNTKTTLRLPG